MCIGNSFALMEAQLIIATVAQAYRLRLASDEKPELNASITLIPRKPIMMNALPRR